MVSNSPSENAIRVQNPVANSLTLKLKLNNEIVTLAPGEEKVLSADRLCLAEFDRGGSFGHGKNSLNAGTFVIQLTDQGWDLRRTATVDLLANLLP